MSEKDQRQNNPSENIPWIQVLKGSSYFITDQGDSWTPIGQNDAITWPELSDIFKRKDSASVEAYFRMLKDHGVTCIRLMLEYCHTEHRYFERPIGRFQPNMVRLWDDIFDLCGKSGLRILLTPYDTYWMKHRWAFHPYNLANGGSCSKRSHWLLCQETRAAIKNRLAFVTERWGASGVLFAWDLWNEIQPTHGGNSVKQFSAFIQDVSSFLRTKEIQMHGRAHPQTVSFFGTKILKDPRVAECAFRHPSLDFANIHFYEQKTINSPGNTIDAALSTGRMTREILAEIKDRRPFFDSEHGPIHYFNNRRKTLDEAFDDEYFRHMQWAHFASGGAGGGMRWPYRHPHTLTKGMRKAQLALSRFLPLICFNDFNCNNLNQEIIISDKTIATFGCGDENQVIVWLLRTDNLDKNGMLKKDVKAKQPCIHLPGMKPGRYQIIAWDTKSGTIIKEFQIKHQAEGVFCLPVPPVQTDMAFAVCRESGVGSRKSGVGSR